MSIRFNHIFRTKKKKKCSFFGESVEGFRVWCCCTCIRSPHWERVVLMQQTNIINESEINYKPKRDKKREKKSNETFDNHWKDSHAQASKCVAYVSFGFSEWQWWKKEEGKGLNERKHLFVIIVKWSKKLIHFDCIS